MVGVGAILGVQRVHLMRKIEAMINVSAIVAAHPALRHTAPSRMNANVIAKMGEILTKVSGANTINHVWGYAAGGGEHDTGRAVDIMVHANKTLGNAIAKYLIVNQARLGIIHILWQQQIWRGNDSTSTNPHYVWERMATRNNGDPTANHRDHLHVWFSTDTYVAPVVTPKPSPKPVPVPTLTLRRGDTGARVLKLQKALNDIFPAYSRLAEDGSFGPKMESVIKEFQRRTGLTRDGVVGAKTRATLATFRIFV